MERISANISYAEAVASVTGERRGIRNVPSAKVLANMQRTAEAIFEPLRAHFDAPINVISFFRSPELNRAVGGSQTSQHMTGEAMDLRGMGGITNAQLFHYIKDHLPFDQLIWEFGTNTEPSWVHVSYSASRPRRQVLRAVRIKGKTVYQSF